MQMEPEPVNREQRRLQKKLEKQSKGSKTKGFSSPADIVAQVVHTEKHTANKTDRLTCILKKISFMQVSSEMSTATAQEERPDSRAGRPQSIADLQTNTFAGAQNRVVAKAEEYNTKKPELVGYEELKQVVAYTVRAQP